MATRREPSVIEPGPDGTRPFGFPRLVQPVLDRRCVECHDGAAGPGKSELSLVGESAGTFSRSYENLRPFVRWYEWGGQSIHQTVTIPGRCGVDSSPLTSILEDATHKPTVRLSAAERQRLHIWLDGNAPFYGTYAERARRAQLAGEPVPPPHLQ